VRGFIQGLALDDKLEVGLPIHSEIIFKISAQEVPPDLDEFALAGVGKASSKMVRSYRVKGSPVQ